MAIFLWDASHYDGQLSTAIMAKAKSEGIVGFTHKLGEGLGNIDATAATALAAARDVGIPVLGGYWFNHGTDKPADEVAAFIREANRSEPWWTDFPGWFWQADLERSPTGLPSPAWAKEFCDRLRDTTGRVVIAYASHGQYGNTLSGLGHPLWNANYPTGRQAGFRDLYPGDSYSGWTKYSGQTPVLAQFTSSATIAGRTTCDANAFRGSVDELLALIGADMPLSQHDADLVVTTLIKDPNFMALIWRMEAVANQRAVFGGGVDKGDPVPNTASLAGVSAAVAGLVKSDAAMLATLKAMAGATPGAPVDTSVLAAQIKAVGDQESAAVLALGQQLAATQQEIADLRAALAASAAAEASALSK